MMSIGNTNQGVVTQYDEDTTPIFTDNKLVSKQSASSWNGNCVYDILEIIVNDAYGGKWLWISAASTTPLNGVYSYSWHQYGLSNSYTSTINQLADNVPLCNPRSYTRLLY